MQEQPCPKCSQPMDEGSISASDQMSYVSKKQTGTFRIAIKIQRARVCLNCGYVEIYLDPNVLKKNIG